jgi:2-C-methyl-D-erythritol 4-phosphate cytidylyltransferase
MPSFCVILAAAGKSSRFNDPAHRKPFAMLAGKAVWLHSAERFLQRTDVKQVVVVISPEDKDEFLSRFGPNVAVLGIDVAVGGAERADSVQNALAKVNNSIEFVAIHDAARPCADADLIERTFAAAVDAGAAIPTIPVASTVKRSLDGKHVQETVERGDLYLAQTPQVFDKKIIDSLYAARGSKSVTDESQLAELNGMNVQMVEGSVLNIKITTRPDLALAKACLESMPTPRFDAPIHPFADDNLFR